MGRPLPAQSAPVPTRLTRSGRASESLSVVDRDDPRADPARPRARSRRSSIRSRTPPSWRASRTSSRASRRSSDDPDVFAPVTAIFPAVAHVLAPIASAPAVPAPPPPTPVWRPRALPPEPEAPVVVSSLHSCQGGLKTALSGRFQARRCARTCLDVACPAQRCLQVFSPPDPPDPPVPTGPAILSSRGRIDVGSVSRGGELVVVGAAVAGLTVAAPRSRAEDASGAENRRCRFEPGPAPAK